MANVACIGVGTVGSGWAAVFARAGHSVALFDANPEIISEFALARIESTLRQLDDAMPTGETVESMLERVRPCTSLSEAVNDAEFIQESVREDLDTKRALFDEIGKLAPRESFFLSSTSALPGSQFLTDIPNPDRALVAHPVNPPSHIPLVELCGTGLTTDEAMETARAFYVDAGMEPITVKKEIDGFILNRLQYTLVAEAMHLVGEGFCSAEDIDRVITSGLALRWASIGPFMTAHLNAPEGFTGFVDRLGPMMKKMGQDAQTDYEWGPALVNKIQSELSAKLPVETIPAGQAWRDKRILATRQMQNRDQRPTKAASRETDLRRT